MNDQINTPTPSPCAWLMDHYPAAFPRARADIKPLKVKIRDDLVAAHPELGPNEARRMLACWCGRPSYLRAVKRGGPRIDLAGEAAGEVSPEQRAHAAQVLKARAEGERLRVAEERARKTAETTAQTGENRRSAPTPAQDTPAPLPAPRVPRHPVLTLKRRVAEQESGQ
jgi:ProP effector